MMRLQWPDPWPGAQTTSTPPPRPCPQVSRNVVHGSDSPENGERETALWFKEGLVAWEQTLNPWLKE